MAGTIALLYVYTFLHEGGHALVGVLYGGTIEKFVLGLNAHVRISGASFTPFGAALFHAAGVLLPVMILVIALAVYKTSHKNIHYHLFHGLFGFGIIGSLFAWIAIPVMAMFSEPPAGDDVTKFLQTTGIHPVMVILATAAVMAIMLFWIVKLGIPNQLKSYHKEFIGRGKIMEGKNSTGSSTLSAKGNEKITGITKIHHSAKGGWRFSIIQMVVITGVILLVAIAGVRTFLQPTYLLDVQVSLQIDESKKQETFHFEVGKSGTYHSRMNLTAEGIITDVQILNKNNQRIHQNLAQSFTMGTTLKLDQGSYQLVLTFLKDQEELRSHFRAMDYNLPQETLNELNAIVEDPKLQLPVNLEFAVRIR